MHVQALADLAPGERRALIDRTLDISAIREDVHDIIHRVRESGDEALRSYSRELDAVDVDRIDITDRVTEARDRIPMDLHAAIREAASNIRAFHEKQRRNDWVIDFDGRELGRRFRPIASVGTYVPGGTATYPSSALMTIIPAAVAGVETIAVATPPADPIDPATFVAIDEAGADRVYGIGGAQAIAAMAYGTESVAPVEKIVGPGNRWVTAAKAAVRGDVEIDFLAGPSEILLIVDHTADPRFVAADMIAQAEHDPYSATVAVTDDHALAERILTELEQQLTGQPRADVIRKAVTSDVSGVFVVDSLDEACAFAEDYAPEHLSIQVANEDVVLESVPSAGSVFLGPYSPVAAGDYASGTNHVLPTGGQARVTGGLSVDAFLRSSTIQRLDRATLNDLRPTITTLAEAEGFHAHAASVETRFLDPPDDQ